MRKAAVAYWLAGLAAAGVGLTTAQASSTTTADVGWVTATQDCSTTRGAGQALETLSKITVGGRLVDDPIPLKRGAKVKTSPGGRGVLCLREGSWECDVWPKTELRVLPPKAAGVLLRLTNGYVICTSPSRADRRLDTSGSSLLVGARGNRSLAWTGDSESAEVSTGGQSVSIGVVKGRTVVKVRRGAGVLTKKRTTRNAVVLGRGDQSVVPARGFPSPPIPLDLTQAERAGFRERERGLPKETDRSAPKVEVRGPRDPSSVRSATFVFTSSETATFSCALDDTDFRLCTTPFDELKRVAPGRHTFLVRATDSAGNTGVGRYSWTVDGSRIAFESFRDGNPEIYTVDPDGQNPLRLTNNVISDEHPDWSPDRRRLVFDRLVGQNLDIYVMNADGSGATRLTEDLERDRNPSWSPDGARIAFESYRDGNREIYVMNADGTGERRLTTDPAEDLDPTWAPDSNRLAFASTRDGNFEIYSMNADGSAQTRLTSHPAVEFGPSWSPKGSRIAFHSLRTDQYQNIFVMNSDGSDVTRLTQTERNDTNPSWAPDARHIVFHSDRESGAEEQLYVLDLDTGAQTRVAAGTTRANFSPDW